LRDFTRGFACVRGHDAHEASARVQWVALSPDALPWQAVDRCAGAGVGGNTNKRFFAEVRGAQ